MKSTINKKILALQAAVLLVAGCAASDEGSHDVSNVDTDTSVVSYGEDRSLPSVGSTGDGVTVEDASIATIQEPVATIEDTFDPDVNYAERGRTAYTKGEFASAMKDLRVAVENQQATDYDVYLFGLSLWKQGQLDEAEQVLIDSTWRMESFPRAHVNLARVRLEREDFNGAKTAVEKAIQIDDTFAPAHNVLGRTLLAMGDADTAADAFQRAAELNPSDPWPLNNLGYSLIVTGRGDEAVQPLEEAVTRDESIGVLWHNLALAREQALDLVGAAQASIEAANRDENNTTFVDTRDRLVPLVPESQIVGESPVDVNATEEASEESIDAESIDTDPVLESDPSTAGEGELDGSASESD